MSGDTTLDNSKVRSSPMVYVLPALHFCVSGLFILMAWETGWYYLERIDIPISIVAGALAWHYDHGHILLVVLGTLWWYLLSRAIEIGFRFIRGRGEIPRA